MVLTVLRSVILVAVMLQVVIVLPLQFWSYCHEYSCCVLHVCCSCVLLLDKVEQNSVICQWQADQITDL